MGSADLELFFLHGGRDPRVADRCRAPPSRLAGPRIAAAQCKIRALKKPPRGVEPGTPVGIRIKARLTVDWTDSHKVPYVSESGRVTAKVDP